MLLKLLRFCLNTFTRRFVRSFQRDRVESDDDADDGEEFVFSAILQFIPTR